MKSIRNMLTALTIGGAAVAAAATTGCYAGEGAYVAYESPPPPQREVAVYRPGYVWVHGHWTRPGGQWRWRPGYYVRERPDYVYVEGHWERRGRGNVWVEGGWRQRGRTVVRRDYPY